jgi:hypothetical protein
MVIDRRILPSRIYLNFLIFKSNLKSFPSMSKSRKFGQSLITKDWMKYRPYDEFSSYDGYYLRQANAIFEFLNKPGREFRDIFHRDQLKEMAIIITCHFEDFISEIGLWRAVVRKHEDLYGKPLPFYDPEDYDPEYLNPQDFAYLIWHQLGRISQKTLDPYAGVLLDAADYCYEFFEKRIDQAPATDFYDDWLDLSSDTYFFDLKRRLIWMTFGNYLIGPEFNRAIKEDIEEFFEESTELVERFDPGKLMYAMQDDFLYKKSSSCCAMTAPDWLAEVARCPEKLRPDIRRLFQRVQGTFLYEGCDDRYYYFQFIRSGRSFPIRRESADIDVAELKAGASVAGFGIVNWCGEWWLSGIFMGGKESPKDLDQLRADPKGANFYGWTEAQQQQLREMTAEMEEAFISYFGDRLVFFPNEKALAEAMQAHNTWWNEHKAKKPEPGQPKSRYEELNEQRFTGYEDLDMGGGAVAAFFSPGEGVMMSTLIPEIIDLLQKEVLTKDENRELFYTFFHEFSPALAHYIAEHYPTDKLRFPMGGGPDFVEEHFDFFLRYYNPGDFRETVPNMTLLPEE